MVAAYNTMMWDKLLNVFLIPVLVVLLHLVKHFVISHLTCTYKKLIHKETSEHN